MLHETLDGAALAGRVPALEEDDQSLPSDFDPLLQLEQLNLEQPLVALVLLAIQSFRVRVTLAPRVDGVAVLRQQDGVIVIVLDNAILAQAVQQHSGHRAGVRRLAGGGMRDACRHLNHPIQIGRPD